MILPAKVGDCHADFASGKQDDAAHQWNENILFSWIRRQKTSNMSIKWMQLDISSYSA